MKVIIADTGALISLGLAGYLNILEQLFNEFYIPEAVWEEINQYDNPDFEQTNIDLLRNKIHPIKSKNYLSVLMDYGESESVILYEEVKADFLLIDDQKARAIAENLNVNCIGSIGLLLKAKEKNIITQLRPVFKLWLRNKRFFSKKLLNEILQEQGEVIIN